MLGLTDELFLVALSFLYILLYCWGGALRSSKHFTRKEATPYLCYYYILRVGGKAIKAKTKKYEGEVPPLALMSLIINCWS